MGMANPDFDVEHLENMLRHAKVAQQSIESVSGWILEHRSFLADIVDVWSRLVMSDSAKQQIVYLYIANDTMQVGARKYGKHIVEQFEMKLLEVVQYIMTESEEKVKRCVLKIVGVWKQRHTVTPEVLLLLEQICAGRPPRAVETPHTTLNEQVMTQKQSFLAELTSDQTRDKVLEDMPEVVEAKETRVMHHRLQELVSATISADLLSDRLFQMESSLSTFQHAMEAYTTEEERSTSSSGGSLVWTLLDPSVFELDIERSHEHVQQYRDNLQIQNAKREDVLTHLRSLELVDSFRDPIYRTSRLVREQQATMVERLYDLCLQAELLETQRRQKAEREAAKLRRIEPVITTYSSSHGQEYNEREYDYYSPSSSTRSRDPYDRDYYTTTTTSKSRPPLERRHSSGSNSSSHREYSDRYERDRYREEEEAYDHDHMSKRSKLHHSHSSGEQEFDRKRSNGRWETPSSSSLPQQWYTDPSPRPYGDLSSRENHWEDRAYNTGRGGGRSYGQERERRW